MVGRRVLLSHVLGQAGRGQVDLVGLLGDSVFAERTGEGAEGAGLEGVHADVEVRGVELADHIRAGEHQHLVAALEIRTAEVVRGEVPRLDACAESAIEDDHTFGRGVGIAAGPHPTEATGGGNRARKRFAQHPRRRGPMPSP